MEHGAKGIGHRAQDKRYGAWGKGHWAQGTGHRAVEAVEAQCIAPKRPRQNGKPNKLIAL